MVKCLLFVSHTNLGHALRIGTRNSVHDFTAVPPHVAGAAFGSGPVHQQSRSGQDVESDFQGLDVPVGFGCSLVQISVGCVDVLSLQLLSVLAGGVHDGALDFVLWLLWDSCHEGVVTADEVSEPLIGIFEFTVQFWRLFGPWVAETAKGCVYGLAQDVSVEVEPTCVDCKRSHVGKI